jgi:hypothetical protein
MQNMLDLTVNHGCPFSFGKKRDLWKTYSELSELQPTHQSTIAHDFLTDYMKVFCSSTTSALFLAVEYFPSLSPFKSRKVCPHVKTDNSSRASSSKPAMIKAAAKASAVVSLVGLPKLTGLPATNSGRQREVPLTCPLRTFSACSQLQSRATSPCCSMRCLSAGEKAVSEKGLSTMALLGRNLNRDTMRINP